PRAWPRRRCRAIRRPRPPPPARAEAARADPSPPRRAGARTAPPPDPPRAAARPARPRGRDPPARTRGRRWRLSGKLLRDQLGDVARLQGFRAAGLADAVLDHRQAERTRR